MKLFKGYGAREKKRKQRLQKKQKKVQLLLSPDKSAPAKWSRPQLTTIRSTLLNPELIPSTDYLVQYCYQNWQPWTTAAQRRLVQVQRESPCTISEDWLTTTKHLEEFSQNLLTYVKGLFYC